MKAEQSDHILLKQKIPLRSGIFTFSGNKNLLHFFNVHSIETLSALDDFVADQIVFTDLVSQTAVMYEDFLVGFVLHNETISLGLIEEFYFTCFH